MRKVMEAFHTIVLLHISIAITPILGHMLTSFQDNKGNVIRNSGNQIMSANILGTKALHLGGDEKGKKNTAASSENKHHMQPPAKLKNRKPKPLNSHTTEPYYTYQPLPPEMQHDVEAFKINMTKCLKQVQKHDNYQVLSPSRPSPIHANCLVACFLNKNEIIVGGRVHKDNLLKLIGKFYAKDGKLMKKLESNIDKCIESSHRHKNECSLAAYLNECTNDILALKHPLNIDF